jgi:predicted nucleic acid-binding protein
LRLYFDSSAIVKLVQVEAESDALRNYVHHRDDQLVTSALSRVEVVRAVTQGGPSAIALARRQLARFVQVALDPELLDLAATLDPAARLRSLDAIHLASARLAGEDLRAVVTYDVRMAAAAQNLHLTVASPT